MEYSTELCKFHALWYGAGEPYLLGFLHFHRACKIASDAALKDMGI